MSDSHIYNSSISSRAIVLLDTYYDKLSHDIKKVGHCTEFLGKHSDYDTTRLLCQSRCMYFLIEYSIKRDDTQAFNHALTLYKHIKSDYYDAGNKQWLQFPKRQKLDNLYEYAFLVFSISKLYSAKKSDEYKKDLEELNSYILRNYFKPETDFDNLKDKSGLVSQNALMHLFESYLELYKAIPDKAYLETLITLLTSATKMFYDSQLDLISEYSPFGDDNTIYEPGHSFEWGCLLLESEQLNLNLSNKINIKGLVASAEQYGVMSQGVVKQSISNLNDKDRYRIWPMLERMRYYLMNQDAAKINNIFPEFNDIFINHQTKLPIEFVDSQLNQDFDGVKTTTSYHLINSLKHLIK
ncbi:AGE family epimerase/isomerase [Francisellaceae bacterium]|nr:AGE family epimerase/isomerase [Francisellaceae bacterium]